MADPEHVAKLLEGVEAWNEWRYANPMIVPNLEEAGLRGANLQGAYLAGANLKGAQLQGADLQEADLAKADLFLANLQGAKLAGANLQSASLFKANLAGADLSVASLQGATLRRADLQGADLAGADLTGADLCAANLEEADASWVRFDRGSRQQRFQCIRISTCYGNQIFKSFAQDQDYIEELRSSGRKGRVLFWLWYVFADCGRSFTVWATWSLGLATSFGYFFHFVIGLDGFKFDHLPTELSTMIYYSVVTFTTLGFGDIKPVTSLASLTVMVEVIVGYVMLGGLISILANKLARRA